MPNVLCLSISVTKYYFVLKQCVLGGTSENSDINSSSDTQNQWRRVWMVRNSMGEGTEVLSHDATGVEQDLAGVLRTNL